MTDDLIERLSADTKAIAPHAMFQLLLKHAGIGGITSAVIVLLFLGIRSDLPTAATTTVFWIKTSYAVLLLVAVFPKLPALSRPLPGNLPWLLLALMVICLAIFAFTQWTNASSEKREALVWGQTALICPWLIMLVSLPMLASLLAALRRLAPMRPTLAGFAAGLIAGGFGVLVYSLHCPETGIPFVAIWYSAGVLGTGLLGAIGGKVWLRW